MSEQDWWPFGIVDRAPKEEPKVGDFAEHVVAMPGYDTDQAFVVAVDDEWITLRFQPWGQGEWRESQKPRHCPGPGQAYRVPWKIARADVWFPALLAERDRWMEGRE